MCVRVCVCVFMCEGDIHVGLSSSFCLFLPFKISTFDVFLKKTRQNVFQESLEYVLLVGMSLWLILIHDPCFYATVEFIKRCKMAKSKEK